MAKKYSRSQYKKERNANKDTRPKATLRNARVYVAECYANKGPTMKRIKPRAQGRAYRIEHRMSHITVVLDER